MKKLILGGGITLVVVATIVYWGIYNKPHRSIDSEAAIKIDAPILYLAFVNDETSANEKYLNKVIQVTGSINSISTNAENRKVIILETNDPLFGINCTLSSDESVNVGDLVTITGICTGYLSDVVMVQCELQPTKE